MKSSSYESEDLMETAHPKIRIARREPMPPAAELSHGLEALRACDEVAMRAALDTLIPLSARYPAVLAAAFPEVGIGLLGVSLAFGLTVLTMAYAIGHISGCHLNLAVSVGLAVGGRFKFSDLPFYIVAQVIGAILATYVLYFIVSGQPGFELTPNGLAVNGFGELSPGKYTLAAGLVTEIVMTAMFLFIILGATDKLGTAVASGLAIGPALTLIHLISIYDILRAFKYVRTVD